MLYKNSDENLCNLRIDKDDKTCYNKIVIRLVTEKYDRKER